MTGGEREKAQKREEDYKNRMLWNDHFCEAKNFDGKNYVFFYFCIREANFVRKVHSMINTEVRHETRLDLCKARDRRDRPQPKPKESNYQF